MDRWANAESGFVRFLRRFGELICDRRVFLRNSSDTMESRPAGLDTAKALQIR
jgi:hypothetical protein